MKFVIDWITHLFAREAAEVAAPANDNPGFVGEVPAFLRREPPGPAGVTERRREPVTEPTSNVIDASTLFLMSLPREKQLRLQRMQRTGALTRMAA